MNLIARQQWRCTHREQTCGNSRGRQETVGWTERVAEKHKLPSAKFSQWEFAIWHRELKSGALVWTSGSHCVCWASLVAQSVKNLPAVQENWVRSLGWEDPLDKEMATHSSILAWKISWSLVGCSPWYHRVGHNWATTLTYLVTYLCLLGCFLKRAYANIVLPKFSSMTQASW